MKDIINILALFIIWIPVISIIIFIFYSFKKLMTGYFKYKDDISVEDKYYWY